jgi:hypothetical protein
MVEAPVEGPVDYDGCTPDERVRAIDSLAQMSNAVLAEIFTIASAIRRAGDWKDDGAASMADWLAYRYNLSPTTAHQWARLARALEHLPALRAAFAGGAISFEQLTHAVRFATPENDTWLAEELPGLNVAQVKAMARAHKPVRDDDAEDAHHRRKVRLRKDRSGLGSWLHGFLPNEMAATVAEALRRRMASTSPDPATGMWPPEDAQRADALHDMCADDLATAAHASSHPDASVVVIHAPASVVDGTSDANATIDSEPITATAVQRLLCDTDIEFNIDDEHGRTVGIGRRSRTIPRWLRRRILFRQGGCCAWPGCNRPIRHIHHINWWTKGGTTDATNLLGLCWFHHHLLHEGRWQATGNADDQVTFRGPNGHTLHARTGPRMAA